LTNYVSVVRNLVATDNIWFFTIARYAVVCVVSIKP
jgi:hypothetical protein